MLFTKGKHLWQDQQKISMSLFALPNRYKHESAMIQKWHVYLFCFTKRKKGSVSCDSYAILIMGVYPKTTFTIALDFHGLTHLSKPIYQLIKTIWQFCLFRNPVSSGSKPLYANYTHIHTAVYAGAACQHRRVKFWGSKKGQTFRVWIWGKLTLTVCPPQHFFLAK